MFGVNNVTQHHSTSVAQFFSIRFGDCFGYIIDYTSKDNYAYNRKTEFY